MVLHLGGGIYEAEYPLHYEDKPSSGLSQSNHY